MKPVLLALVLALPLASTAACDASGASAPANGASAGAEVTERVTARVTGAQARELVASGATLLDVRTVEEWQAGHLDGAVNIPVAELGGRLAELPKDRPVVVYCRSGSRSKRAAQQLAGAGHRVHDLGPMDAWTR